MSSSNVINSIYFLIEKLEKFTDLREEEITYLIEKLCDLKSNLRCDPRDQKILKMKLSDNSDLEKTMNEFFCDQSRRDIIFKDFCRSMTESNPISKRRDPFNLLKNKLEGSCVVDCCDFSWTEIDISNYFKNGYGYITKMSKFIEIVNETPEIMSSLMKIPGSNLEKSGIIIEASTQTPN